MKRPESYVQRSNLAEALPIAVPARHYSRTRPHRGNRSANAEATSGLTSARSWGLCLTGLPAPASTGRGHRESCGGSEEDGILVGEEAFLRPCDECSSHRHRGDRPWVNAPPVSSQDVKCVRDERNGHESRVHGDRITGHAQGRERRHRKSDGDDHPARLPVFRAHC